MERIMERERAKEAAPKSTPAPAAESAEESVTETAKEAMTSEGGQETSKTGQSEVQEKAPEKGEFQFPDLPKNIREALGVIPDKKVREQIAAIAYMGKEFRDIRMTPGEGKALRQMYPTLQVAQQAHTAAGFAYDLAQAYHSNTPEGFEHFASNLRTSNAQAYTGFVNKITENLFKENPQAYRKVANQGLRNFIANMRQKAEIAERNGDAARAHEYTTAAQINEETAFPQGVNPRQNQRPANDPLVQQVQALQAEKSAFLQQRQQASYQNVVGRVEAELVRHTGKILSDADPDKLYPEKGRAAMAKKIVDGVREKVRSNQHVGVTLSNLINQGNEQGAIEFLLNQAKNHLDAVAGETLNEYAEEFGAIQQARQQKLATVVSQKDVGSAGAALPKASGKVTFTRGMSTHDKLMAMAKAKMRT